MRTQKSISCNSKVKANVKKKRYVNVQVLIITGPLKGGRFWLQLVSDCFLNWCFARRLDDRMPTTGCTFLFIKIPRVELVSTEMISYLLKLKQSVNYVYWLNKRYIYISSLAIYLPTHFLFTNVNLETRPSFLN